jgi:spermidine synthase
MKKKLAIAFFFSGAAALVYQVLWARMLGLVFGNTTYAISTVLAAFMGGMALGSYALGRYAERTGVNPVRTLAYMEAAAGIYCALTPLLFAAAGRGYVLAQQSFDLSLPVLTIFRFVLSSAIMLLPTFLMGGTLPVMAKALKGLMPAEELSGAIGSFYGINTLGAVFGVVFSAFFSIAYFGVNATLAAAVAVNLAVAVSLYVMGRGEKMLLPAPAAEAVPAADHKLARMALGAAAISGFVAMLCEVLWTRILSLVIGMSVYAFATMLCSFLFGIAAGSFIFTKFAGKIVETRGKKAFFAVGSAFGLAGVLILMTIPAFNHLPLLFLSLFNFLERSFAGFVFIQTVISFSVMLLPAVIFGFMFPLLAKIYLQARGEGGGPVSGALGRVYAFNTIGAIAGSTLSGFVLISALGLEGSIRTAGFVTVILAILLIFYAVKEVKAPAWAAIGFLAFFAAQHAIAMGSWDKRVMTSGVYQYAPEIIRNAESQDIGIAESFRQIVERKENLYFKDGAGFSVAVSKDKVQGFLSLSIDGKVDASNNYSADMNTQLLSGHLPLLLHPNPKKVLVIGLASGVTLGAVAGHPVEEIDCVEIEPSMLKAAGYFEQWNRSVLKDPRVKIISNDGRNYLLSTKKKYDIIISEPSNPWISAASPLFTSEYFKLVSKRLAPGGVFCQWMQLYAVQPSDIKSVLGTVKSVFPSVSLWNPYGFDTLAIATPGKFSVDYADLEKRFALARPDMASLGIKNIRGLLVKFVMAGPELDAFIKGAELNTDNRPVLEFSAPKSLYNASLADANYRLLQSNVHTVSPYLAGGNGGLALAEEYLQSGVFGGAESELKLLAQKSPGAKIYDLLGYALQRQKKFDEAKAVLEKAAALDVTKPDAFVGLSQVWLAENNAEKALFYAKKALAAGRSALSYNQMGLTQLKLGNTDEAVKNFSMAYKTTPSFIPAYINEAIVYTDFLKVPAAAVEVLSRAASAKPNDASVFFQLGRAMQRMGMLEQAAGYFNSAIYLDESYRRTVGLELAGIRKAVDGGKQPDRG